jgi:hypothetical protein
MIGPLRATRPSRRAALLIKALTGAVEQAQPAWEDWQAEVGDIPPLLAADHAEVYRSLLPLVQVRIESGVLHGPPSIGTFARAATVRESLRADTYIGIFRSMINALENRCDVAVVSGLALAADFYGAVERRHSGAIELIVPPEQLTTAVRLLEAADAEVLHSPTKARTTRQWLLHSSGLTLGVASELASHPYHSVPLSPWASSFEDASIGGLELARPKPHLALFEALLRGAYSTEATSLAWAFDASFIIGCRSDLDWEAFLEAVGAAQAALAVFESLDWLAGEVGAPIPSSVILAVNEQRTRAPAAAKDLALSAAWLAVAASPRALLRECSGPRDVWTCARWALAPHPTAMSWIADAPTPAALFSAYLKRPLSWLTGAAGSSPTATRGAEK